MIKIDLTYVGDLRCHAIHTPSGQSLNTDAPVDNHGKGETFSPTDLLATSLGACMLTIMGIIANREQINIEGTTVSVLKEMTTTPPRRVAKLTVQFHVQTDLTDTQKQKLINAAHTCPVHRSLHPDVEIITQFNWK